MASCEVNQLRDQTQKRKILVVLLISSKEIEETTIWLMAKIWKE